MTRSVAVEVDVVVVLPEEEARRLSFRRLRGGSDESAELFCSDPDSDSDSDADSR